MAEIIFLPIAQFSHGSFDTPILSPWFFFVRLQLLANWELDAGIIEPVTPGYLIVISCTARSKLFLMVILYKILDAPLPTSSGAAAALSRGSG